MLMNEYPFSFEDLKNRFRTEKQCVDYLYNLRWENGFSCPRCEFNEVWQINEKKYKCKNCGYQTTVTSGTYLQGTHISLTIWFEAIWYVVSQRGESNAMDLQEFLNLGNNRTALNLLNKIRTVMKECDSEKLHGEIFVDDIKLYSKREPKESNTFLAVEMNADSISRIRLHTDSSVPYSFKNFIEKYIEQGSRIHIKNSEKYIKYQYLPHGYSYLVMKDVGAWSAHPKTKHIFEYLKQNNLYCHTPRNSNHSFKSLCMDECCYKYNRKDKDIGFLFHEILYNAVHMKP